MDLGDLDDLSDSDDMSADEGENKSFITSLLIFSILKLSADFQAMRDALNSDTEEDPSFQLNLEFDLEDDTVVLGFVGLRASARAISPTTPATAFDINKAGQHKVNF